MIGPIEWEEILRSMGVKPLVALEWRDSFASEVQADRFSAGMADLVDWLPQILHECQMLQVMEERLSYSAERLVQVWPSRFPSVAIAQHYANNPEKLANKVYGDRMGNRQPGDGWKYRGRTPIMITGFDAYLRMGQLIGMDLVRCPERALEKPVGLRIAIAWWEDRIPDAMLSDQVRLRKKVNGGTIGLEHVQALATRAREVFA